MKMKDLGPRGRAFWRDQHKDLEFDAHEEQLLFEACQAMDTIDELRARVDADGVMVTGSQGQPVLHPAVAELRQQQAQMSRLLDQLHLDTPELGSALSVKSAASRAAAQKRWRDRKAASA